MRKSLETRVGARLSRPCKTQKRQRPQQLSALHPRQIDIERLQPTAATAQRHRECSELGHAARPTKNIQFTPLTAGAGKMPLTILRAFHTPKCAAASVARSLKQVARRYRARTAGSSDRS